MSTLFNIIFIAILGLAFVSARIQKREEPCVGCPTPANVNDPELKNYVIAVMVQKNYPGDVIKIIKATQQVVAGIKYVVEFEAKIGGETKICDTSFVYQAWKEVKLEILDFECLVK
uniref:Secreted Cystatin-like protein n=1 Tax=Pristhesancus plagipennis TaxID=1955184 RepID=A0A2K8JWG0_PRIPG|nr:secreted Cystatin-like protein [Pristhesancus plagipennis]